MASYLKTISCCLFLFLGGAGQAAPRVELELLVDPTSLGTAQKWIKFLSQCDFADVRISSGQGSARAKIDQKGEGDRARYIVTGFITPKNRMVVPGGQFRLSDKKKINEWIATVKTGGEKELFAVRGTFGLTSEELVEVHEKLRTPLTFQTKSVRSGDVARAIVKLTKMPYSVDDSALAGLGSRTPVNEELKGLTAGTALAATLRPLGIVLVPRKPKGRPVELHITTTRKVKRSWPVGWPPRQSPGKTVPQLFKFLTIQVNSTLDEALPQIQERVKIPFLFDQNSMARQMIELKGVKVKTAGKRSFYKKIIDELLRQGLLKSEVRVDEAGTPFLWISTLK